MEGRSSKLTMEGRPAGAGAAQLSTESKREGAGPRTCRAGGQGKQADHLGQAGEGRREDTRACTRRIEYSWIRGASG